MASLKDVKMKIVGVKKTKQITKAMHMVASAKLRGAQMRIENFRPYANKFQTILSDIAQKSGVLANPLLEEREIKVACIILVTSDRGLCGGFNAMLIAKALDRYRQLQKEGIEVKFMCVGKKGRDAVRKLGIPMLSSYIEVLSNFDFTLALTLGKNIISDFMTKQVDQVEMISGEFLSVARQQPRLQKLLPITASNLQATETPKTTEPSLETEPSSEYIYEPEAPELLASLLPRFVNVQLHRGFLDTSASEHAARMSAMNNATRNCDEIVAALTLLYNKTRQTAITNELIDIVGGAEALQ